AERTDARRTETLAGWLRGCGAGHTGNGRLILLGPDAGHVSASHLDGHVLVAAGRSATAVDWERVSAAGPLPPCRAAVAAALVTVDCAVEFFAECAALDEVEVHMTLHRQNANRITMGFEYLRAGPTAELLARGRQTVACMRRTCAGLAPLALPGPLADALAR